MISTRDRRQAIVLIEEAVAAGARRARAGAALGLSVRSVQCWSRGGEVSPRRAEPDSGSAIGGRPRCRLPCWLLHLVMLEWIAAVAIVGVAFAPGVAHDRVVIKGFA